MTILLSSEEQFQILLSSLFWSLFSSSKIKNCKHCHFPNKVLGCLWLSCLVFLISLSLYTSIGHNSPLSSTVFQWCTSFVASNSFCFPESWKENVLQASYAVSQHYSTSQDYFSRSTTEHQGLEQHCFTALVWSTPWITDSLFLSITTVFNNKYAHSKATSPNSNSLCSIQTWNKSSVVQQAGG